MTPRQLFGAAGLGLAGWSVLIGLGLALAGCGSTASIPVVDPTTATTPLQSVAALKADLLDAELAAAPILSDVSMSAATKTAIKQAITAAHNAVEAAETAAEAGGSGASTALAAAASAIDSVNAAIQDASAPPATPTTTQGDSP